MKKLFELHQKFTLVVNEYRVLKDQPDGKQTVGFARQKRLAIREQFTLYSDESQSRIIATSAARSVIDLGAIYDIQDPDGKKLAAIKKEFRKSLLVSTWTVFNPQTNETLFTLSEKSVGIAIFRRIWDFLPYVGDVAFPIKYHFVITSNGSPAGEFIKITRFRDHYALYLQEEFEDKLDERAWMITAVLMDAMQSR
ncbi:MAG: hypothetical protein JWO96_26 [Candidatus Saccharibacteria bacterium]|nr:hypothetical protein [Candidatus Saccharibacteria bacterium]